MENRTRSDIKTDFENTITNLTIQSDLLKAATQHAGEIDNNLVWVSMNNFSIQLNNLNTYLNELERI